MEIVIRILFLAILIGANIPIGVSKDSKAELKWLGQTDGKVFYVGTVKMNWVKAKAFCENFNMKLVKIESEAEASILRNNLEGIIPRVLHVAAWTDGVVIINPNNFQWESNGAKIDTSLFSGYNFPPGYQTCLGVVTFRGHNPTLSAYRCDFELFPLCEQ